MFDKKSWRQIIKGNEIVDKKTHYSSLRFFKCFLTLCTKFYNIFLQFYSIKLGKKWIFMPKIRLTHGPSVKDLSTLFKAWHSRRILRSFLSLWIFIEVRFLSSMAWRRSLFRPSKLKKIEFLAQNIWHLWIFAPKLVIFFGIFHYQKVSGNWIALTLKLTSKLR